MYYPIYSVGIGNSIIKNKQKPTLNLRRNLFLCFPLECQIWVGTESLGTSTGSSLKNIPISKSNQCVLCSYVSSIFLMLPNVTSSLLNVRLYENPAQLPRTMGRPSRSSLSVVLFQWSRASPPTPHKGKETRANAGPQVRMRRTASTVEAAEAGVGQ